ncbi:MAG: radical SAM protein [Patescibacteria group bacterium]
MHLPKNRNVLLVAPTLITEVPMTLAMLGAIFKQEGFSVSTAVNTFRRPLSKDDFLAAARSCNAGIVGINMLTIDVLNIYELVKMFKKEGCVVILGGPHPSSCPEEGIKYGADIIVQNEGEITVQELCRFWKNEGNTNIKDIKGITYRNSSGEIVSNFQRERISDLGALPVPDVDIFNLDLFRTEDGLCKGVQRIFTSRGCPGICTFCSRKVFGQRIYYYPIPELVAEIQRRVDRFGITSFLIADDCFTTNKKYVYEFCNLVSQIKPKIVWRTSSRVNLVDADMLKAMKEAGCHYIAFGLESGDPETLRRIRKGIKMEDNIRIPHLAAEIGLQVFANMMIGFPWETEKSIDNNIKYMHEISDAVYLYQVAGAVTPFPGTEIYNEYSDEYDFKEYWLRPKHQGVGIQIYQNSLTPYALSTYYQRNLFDDTVIQEDLFFSYSKEYKRKVSEFVFEIGKHNLQSLYPNEIWRRRAILTLSALSMCGYKLFPKFEKKLGNFLFKNKRSGAENIRDKKRGYVKSKENVFVGSRQSLKKK